jgi:glycerol-3-phosphate cytidylyltransferase-like family protein
MAEKLKKKKKRPKIPKKKRKKHLATLDWCQTCFLDLKN